MRENEIRSLPENLFGTELIFITSTLLFFCADDVTGLRKAIFWAENQLEKATTPNLVGIDVQMNQISSFENTTFLNLKMMTHLLLNDNLIEEIPDYSFQDLGSLQELHLQNVSYNCGPVNDSSQLQIPRCKNSLKHRIDCKISHDWLYLVCKQLRKFISKETISRA